MSNNKKQRTSATCSSENTTGNAYSAILNLSSSLTNRITNKLHPDATIADLGKPMEAYYDEKTKRWILPGDDDFVHSAAAVARRSATYSSENTTGNAYSAILNLSSFCGQVWSSLTNRIINKLHPDTTIADLGKPMEAYYDEKTRRWNLPGDDFVHSAVEDANKPLSTCNRFCTFLPTHHEKIAPMNDRQNCGTDYNG